MSSDSALQPITSRHVAKGLGTTLLARLGAVVELVAQPLYVLMFGLTGFGFYAVLWAAVNLLENIFDLAMTGALQRTVPQSATRQEAATALRTALLFGVGPCLLAATAIFFVAPHVAHIFNVAAEHQALLIPSIKIFVWALPLWAFIEIMTSAMRAQMVFGAEIRLRIIWEQILRMVFAALACGAAVLISMLPDMISIPMVLLTALVIIWCCLRFALLVKDRASWGKMGCTLRVIS